MLCNTVCPPHVSLSLSLSLSLSPSAWKHRSVCAISGAFHIKQKTDTEREGVRKYPRIFKCSDYYSGKIELGETGDAGILKRTAFTGGTG